MLSQRMQANLLYRWFVTDEEMDRPEENRLLEPWRSIFRTAEADIDMNEGLILGLSAPTSWCAACTPSATATKRRRRP